MDIGSVVNQGLIGMQSSRAEIVKSAEQITQVATSSEASTIDLVEPIVNMQVQQQVFTSSARVVEVGQDNIGTLLDVTG